MCLIACPTHHPILGLGLITNKVLFCHHRVLPASQREFWFSVSASLMNWVRAHTNTDSTAWEMKPACPSRLRTQELPCISVPFFIPENLSFLSLTTASGCFLLTCHGTGPESIKNTLLWLLTHCHHDGPEWKEGRWWLQATVLISLSVPGSNHIYADGLFYPSSQRQNNLHNDSKLALILSTAWLWLSVMMFAIFVPINLWIFLTLTLNWTFLSTPIINCK